MATLLEGAGCDSNFSNIPNQTLILLNGVKFENLGNKVIKAFSYWWKYGTLSIYATKSPCEIIKVYMLKIPVN